MRDTPNVRKGTAIIVKPTTNAAAPPDGDREPLRVPLSPRYNARRNGTTGTCDSQVIVVDGGQAASSI